MEPENNSVHVSSDCFFRQGVGKKGIFLLCAENKGKLVSDCFSLRGIGVWGSPCCDWNALYGITGRNVAYFVCFAVRPSGGTDWSGSYVSAVSFVFSMFFLSAELGIGAVVRNLEESWTASS